MSMCCCSTAGCAQLVCLTRSSFLCWMLSSDPSASAAAFNTSKCLSLISCSLLHLWVIHSHYTGCCVVWLIHWVTYWSSILHYNIIHTLMCMAKHLYMKFFSTLYTVKLNNIFIPTIIIHSWLYRNIYVRKSTQLQYNALFYHRLLVEYWKQYLHQLLQSPFLYTSLQLLWLLCNSLLFQSRQQLIISLPQLHYILWQYIPTQLSSWWRWPLSVVGICYTGHTSEPLL